MKYSNNFMRPLPTIGMIILMLLSVICLSYAIKTIPVGTAYAIWTGSSIAAVAILGIILFNEPATITRLVSIGVIIIGIVLLHNVEGA